MHQVYFKGTPAKAFRKKKISTYTMHKKERGKRLCMPDIKKKRWSVDRGALTILQGGTLYQARSDLLQTILAISQQFIHRLENVFCHFINKQRWWSFSDYAGKNNMFPAPTLQYGIYQHLAHQEPHAFFFFFTCMKKTWLGLCFMEGKNICMQVESKAEICITFSTNLSVIVVTDTANIKHIFGGFLQLMGFDFNWVCRVPGTLLILIMNEIFEVMPCASDWCILIGYM